ncbi:alpha/beta fold hydrolase [Candidatus Saccharibacteria bacterium]|nr:alpha/beta fold hydrolase [Candidatus Saccharibacteria bacterium]
MDALSIFWHRSLGRPFRLAKTVDIGNGETVVLLHGIGRSTEVWDKLIERLKGSARVVAFDLLGFGVSAKPHWIDYTTEDHSRSVIASIVKLRAGRPVVVVGHSMGCLVAARVARQRPDLVKQLVLFEMPLYDGLPDRRYYKLRLDIYRRLYTKVIAMQPTFERSNAKLLERLASRIVAFEINEQSWTPFVRSLKNTILEQTAASDIKALRMPVDVIYGSRDMLVIRGKAQQIFGSDSSWVTAHTIRARHEISKNSSDFLYERIKLGIDATPNKSGHSRLKDLLLST